jgi:hypothetical protein
MARWLTAFVVTVGACTPRHADGALGPLQPSVRGSEPGTQAEIAAMRNTEGIVAYRAGKFGDATAKFREAVARVPEARYLLNLCSSLFGEDKLAEARTACGAIADGTPALRSQAERAVAHIEAEGRRRGIDTRPLFGNPPPPGFDGAP